MSNIKLIAGSLLIIISMTFIFISGISTGAVIGDYNLSYDFSFSIFLVMFLSGMLLLSSGKQLEDLVEKKEGFSTRLRKNLSARIIGATILGGVGAYTGHKTGENLQTYTKPVERAYQISQIIGQGVIPGSAQFKETVAKKYLSELGTEGKQYLLKRKNKNNEAYYRQLTDSLQLVQESAGNITHKATDKFPGLNQAQKLNDKIYTKVGEFFGANEIGTRSEETYRQNYDALAMKKLNALIRLNQVNGQVDNTLTQLSMQAARPEKNKEAMAYLGVLSKEANNIYNFLEGKENLSVDQIYMGNRDNNYSEIRELGGAIRGADYPISDNLPLAGAGALGLLGAAAGSYAGHRTRKTIKYAGKSAKYMGKKARQVQEKIISRRKIK